MTATLIVLLIITLVALIFIPFSKALMRDRRELRANPMERKFGLLISRINTLMMNGSGEVIKTSNPRQVNLFSDDVPNMLICIFYSTGIVTVTLKYKYYQVELVKDFKYYDMREADAFRQTDVANSFAEDAAIAIQQHQRVVSGKLGLRADDGDFVFPHGQTTTSDDDPIGLMRGMFDRLTLRQKVASLNLARIIYAKVYSEDAFRNHTALNSTLLSLQINASQVFNAQDKDDINSIASTLHKSTGAPIYLILLIVMPFMDNGGVMEREFMRIMSLCGYTKDNIEQECQKMALIMQQFGV